MNNEGKYEIKTQLQLRHKDENIYHLMIVRETQQFYLAIYFNQAVCTYKAIDNLIVAKIILNKLHKKLLSVKNNCKLNGLLTRAFRFNYLYHSLFFLNLFELRKIHPYYIEVLTKRYNLKGFSYFTFNANNEIQNSIIEVRFPPKNELFGIFISKRTENYFRFQMHRKFKRILRAQKK